MQYTIEQIGARARARNPKLFEKYSDTQIGQRLVDRNPKLKSLVKQEAPQAKLPEAKPKMNFLQEAGQDVKETFQNISKRFDEGADRIKEIEIGQRKGEQGPLRSTIQTFGAGAGTASKSIGDLVLGISKIFLPQSAEDKVSEATEKTVESVVNSRAVKPVVEKSVVAYDKLKKENPALARDLQGLFDTGMLALDVAGIGLTDSAIRQTKNALQKGINIIKDGGKNVADITIDIGESAKSKIPKATELLQGKKPTPKEAVGQVLQGKTKDIESGVRALSKINTEAVETFEDLNKVISDNIKKLAQQVDEDLGLDTARRKLKDLVINSKTQGGKVVKSNPVEKALEQLQEMYTKIGDDVQAANIKEFLAKAKKEGLTSLEINNLARDYGQEFGKKAFSKTGEALTSVNAKLYENVRTQLKELARQGIKGKAAQLADKTMSDLYKVRDLVAKNVEAVNKIRQKIQNRGLLEKIGDKASKYINMISGNSLRGFVSGMLPRGVGYKTMNALDLEEVLKRNLQIIRDAIKAGTDKEIIDILKKIK